MAAPTSVDNIAAPDRSEAAVLAAAENARFVDLVRGLQPEAAGDLPQIDGMTEVQVRERAQLRPQDLVDQLTVLAPRAARGRQRVPALLRRMPMKIELAMGTETWRLGYLLDIIFTRGTWMHRVDISRATAHDLVLTREHDGRIVADVVAEWARRHGHAFTLELTGTAGGSFTKGDGGEHITLDAIEFCRILSGRAAGAGLLTRRCPSNGNTSHRDRRRHSPAHDTHCGDELQLQSVPRDR